MGLTHRGLGFVVVGLADVHPLRGRHAIDDERRECICIQGMSRIQFVGLCARTVSSDARSESTKGHGETEGLHFKYITKWGDEI